MMRSVGRSSTWLVLILTLVLNGCGLKNFISPATGGLVVSVAWPERQGLQTQAIPGQTDTIAIRIAGEGIFQEALQVRIARRDLKDGTVFDAVPVGRKQITAEAFAADGTRLASAREDFKITGGALNEVELTMRVIPLLQAIEPGAVPAGGRVTIRGEHFGEPSASSAVYLGSLVLASTSVIHWDDQEITFDVPPTASTGRQQVVVLTGTVASAPQVLEIQPATANPAAPAGPASAVPATVVNVTPSPGPSQQAAPINQPALPAGTPPHSSNPVVTAPSTIPVLESAAPSLPEPVLPSAGPVPPSTAPSLLEPTPPPAVPTPTPTPAVLATPTPAPTVAPALTPTIVTVSISPNPATINVPAADGRNSGDLPTTVQLTATVIWSDGMVDGDVIWTSSDTSRATVDLTGRVAAQASAQAGVVTITAVSRRNPSHRATASVTVNRKGQGILIIS